MPGYRGKVAVVTGAASGIGYAVAARAAAEGMTVVLADIDTGKLCDAAAALRGTGADVHSVWVDVSDRESVTDLARRVREDAGEAWLLVNNAGVYVSAPFTQTPAADWEFVVGVNLWGVVHCMQAFLPGMVERDSGHIVNTSSIDGLVTVRNAAGYVAAKHAVSALSETVYRELEEALVGRHLGPVPGRGRHRHPELGTAQAVPPGPGRAGSGTRLSAAGRRHAAGQAADIMFAGLRERRFWILTHPEQNAPAIRARAEDIVTGRNPGDESVDPNFSRSTGRTPS